MKKWIGRCIKDHPECCPNSRPQKWYPSRLLDVGSSSESQSPMNPTEAKFRVHDTKNQETLGHYMTVSHRWGDKQPISLTQNSAADLKGGMLVSELPKTFADAVKVAWELGIRYIWIDSLCIYQDSEHEWQSESAKMGLVYKNSWLNIAAIDSSDCNGGCFFQRDKRLVEPIKMKFKDDEKEFLCIDSNLWLVGIDGAPLSKRAWVLQERLLSPRQIHFGVLQLYWECRRHAACETLPGSMLASILDLMSAENTDAQNTRKATPLDVYTGWRHSVQNYSKCSLTYPRDKLIAISGVAKEMSKVINDQYLAGLWRSQLPTTLLWSAEPSGPASSIRYQKSPAGSGNIWTRPRPLRAPTWSWASLD
ncbi:HET-domain-containing protein, partial [Mytilinidion resinicola]